MEAAQIVEPKAFDGIRIIDFTHVLSGPVASAQLAMQGAQVIKIEPREGEISRATPVSELWSARGMGPLWMAVNVNKRSLTLDLRKPQATDIVCKLVAGADVLCENFRPGVMDKLGIGWSALSALNPRLIYCSVSGFGTTGPHSRTAAFDGKIQALSGLMMLTGDPAGGPMRAGFPVADMVTGVTAAFAVASALFQRTHTGRGQFVDVSMLESLLGVLTCQIAENTMTGFMHPQFGNSSVSLKPTSDRFRCGNGWIVLAAMTEKQFSALMRSIQRADLLADPRFADWPARIRHAADLRIAIEAGFDDGRSPIEWEASLTAVDVPCSAISKLSEAIQHEQLAYRGFLQTVSTHYGDIRLAGPAFRFAHGNGGIDRAPPALGEHNDEILHELGYQPEQIASLRSEEVI